MTSSKLPRFHIFYGWWIVAAGMLCMLLAGGIGFYTFGAFFIPIIDELGWSRTQLSLGMTIASVLGLAAPLVGSWVDKYGARIVMAIGALITGSAFALLGLTQSLWYFYLMCLILASGHFGILNIPVTKVVSNWFVKRRGLAIGITLTGFGLGGLFMLPLASQLIVIFDWRIAYNILGLIILVVLIPLSIFVIRERPEEMGLLPDCRSADEPVKRASIEDAQVGSSWTLSGALRTKTFWLIVGAFSLAYFGTAAVSAHAIPFFQDMGVSPQLAATMLATVTGVSILSRVAAGYITDRVSIKYVTIFALLLQLLALVILLEADSTAIFWAFVVVFGLAMGAMFAVEPLMVSKYFGLTSFGAIYGGLWALEAAGWAGGAPLAGYIFDVTGSYDLAFIVFIAATLLAMALISLVKPAK
jgi:sugar phosphate permease